MRIYGKANVVVAVSKEDADAFQKLALSYNKKIPTRMIVAPYTAQDTKDQSSISPFQERKNQLLIVGNPHRIAFDSMVWFLSEVWPVLRVKKPKLRFKIVGKRWQLLLDRSSLNMTSSSTPMDWASIGIDFMEFVEQEDLDNKLFQESKVFLVPHKNATGVSTKIIEALSRGIPIVTNSWGKQGLNLEANDSPDDVLFATDSNDAFIKGIINLLDNKKAWDTMSLAGLHHAKTHLNEDVVFKAMMSALEEGSADINMASSSRRLSEPLRRRLPQTFPSWIEHDHVLEKAENLKGQEDTLEKRWSRRTLKKNRKKRKHRKKMRYPWIKTKTYPWVDEKKSSSQDALHHTDRTRPWGKRKKYVSYICRVPFMHSASCSLTCRFCY